MRRQFDDGNADSVLVYESLAPSLKRRRTIVDAFESFRIAEDNNNVNDTAARHHVYQEGNTLPSNGIDDIMFDADSDDDDDDDDDEEAPLTTHELAQREIMRAIVFGRRPFQPAQQQQDPVEQKLQDLIRGSIQEAVRHKHDSQCDMDIKTSYNRPSLSMEGFVGNLRPRSNSLPNEFNQDNEMDITFL